MNAKLYRRYWIAGAGSRKMSRGQQIISAVGVFIMLFLSGCGDFFAAKPTELQSLRIRKDMRVIRPVPDANVYESEVYKTPPKIVEQTVDGQAEWKLFYFCRHHTVDKLASIVKEQFATKLFDKKGKSTTIPDYTISSNLPTNQLIVRCPNHPDVEAVLELLEMVDVPPIQVKIDCLISEIYADKTLDWETTIEIGDLLGEDISLGGSARLFGSDVLALITEGTTLPAFPGASLREVARAKMGLKIGYYSTAHDFLAVVDLLESKGYLKVLMNPSLEVVNGQKARIQSSERVPLEKMYLHDREGFVETKDRIRRCYRCSRNRSPRFRRRLYWFRNNSTHWLEKCTRRCKTNTHCHETRNLQPRKSHQAGPKPGNWRYKEIRRTLGCTRCALSKGHTTSWCSVLEQRLRGAGYRDDIYTDPDNLERRNTKQGNG